MSVFHKIGEKYQFSCRKNVNVSFNQLFHTRNYLKCIVETENLIHFDAPKTIN